MEDILEQRKEKILRLFKEKIVYNNLIISTILGVIIAFGFYIRTRNLHLLVDITTSKFIPSDLDALVIMRYVKEIAETGVLSNIDILRYYPLGFHSVLGEFGLLSYFIFYLHKFLSFFNSSISLELADVLYPPIAFVFAAIFFYLFVKRLFDYRIALLASAFLATVPIFLQRTMAGWSDKEALALAFMFLALYSYVAAWKSKTLKKGVLLSILSGIATGMTGLVWGGVNFIFLAFGLFALAEISLDKFKRNDLVVYGTWVITSIFIMNVFGFGRYPIVGTFVASFTSGVMIFVLLMGIIWHLMFNYNLFKARDRINEKIPKGVVAFIVAAFVSLVATFLLFGLSFIKEKITGIYIDLIEPFGKSRWALTVAESHQPYIRDWINGFGWVYMLLFLAGSIILFYEMIKHIKKNRIKATLLYALFIIGFTFSRYSPGAVFNGVTTLSKTVYIGSLIVFVGTIITYYLYSFYKNKESYEEILNIDKTYVFIFIFLVLMVVAGRSAARLVLLLAPITAILAAYILLKAYDYVRNEKTKTGRLAVYFISFIFTYLTLTLLFKGLQPTITFFLTSMIGILIAYILVKAIDSGFWKISQNTAKILAYAIILALIIFPLNTFAETSLEQAKYIGPVYNQQWQIGMDWVKKNTPEDAVFAHWWDYGYIVQFGAERATLSDGGNSRGAINHWIGRHVLTGQSDTEALQLLKANNATHLLIISDEIGKYPAFSSIGADVNYDRYSWINTFTLNPDIQEGRNGSILVYQGGTPLDDDFVYQGRLFPAGSAGIGAFLINIVMGESNTFNLNGVPLAVIIYNGQQTNVPLSCLYLNDQKVEFEADNALPGCLRIIPVIGNNNQANTIGAGLYLSPDVKKSRFAELYLFNGNNENFKLVYDDSKNIPLAIYDGRLIGPLKIWEVNYPKNLKVPEEFYGTELPDPRVDLVRR